MSTALQSSVNAYHNGIRDHNRHGKANHADKRIKGGNHKFKRRHFEPVHPDNDMLALDSGYASLVPCKIDVTDYDFMATLNNWIL